MTDRDDLYECKKNGTNWLVSRNNYKPSRRGSYDLEEHARLFVTLENRFLVAFYDDNECTNDYLHRLSLFYSIMNIRKERGLPV